jgi:hexokinase
MTRWDDHLNQTHRMPDFQPLEYMITGRYVGEIVRLIIVEAVETAGLFNGELPISLREPYSLDTSIVAAIIADDTAAFSTSSKLLQTRHPSSVTPTVADLFFLRTVCAAVSGRAAGYLATSIHALWQLKNGAEAASPDVDSLAEEVQMEACTPTTTDDTTPSPPPKITIACEGSVINKFPGFRDSCQRYISEIIAYECATLREELLDDDSVLEDTVILAPAREGAIFGAAVAVACLEEDAHSE